MSSVADDQVLEGYCDELGEYAEREHLAEFIHGLFDLTQHQFPTAHVRLEFQPDPEIAFILFVVEGTGLDTERMIAAEAYWRREIRSFCPNPDALLVFCLHLRD